MASSNVLLAIVVALLVASVTCADDAAAIRAIAEVGGGPAHDLRLGGWTARALLTGDSGGDRKKVKKVKKIRKRKNVRKNSFAGNQAVVSNGDGVSNVQQNFVQIQGNENKFSGSKVGKIRNKVVKKDKKKKGSD